MGNTVVNRVKLQTSALYSFHKVTPNKSFLSFFLTICFLAIYQHYFLLPSTYLIHSFTTYLLNFNTSLLSSLPGPQPLILYTAAKDFFLKHEFPLTISLLQIFHWSPMNSLNSLEFYTKDFFISKMLLFRSGYQPF